jgi:mono/diheme cytochrome c family protein
VIRSLIAAAVAIVVVAAAVLWWLSAPARLGSLPPYSADAAHGREVFLAGGCASCHATPNQPDMQLLGGGLALPTAFGTFHVPNISPDPKAGIGAWSEHDFADALLLGTGRGGINLYPALPYTSYHLMTLDDVRDLYAYLRTLPPSPNVVPPHDLRFPFDIRRGIGLWKAVYFRPGPFRPDPVRSAEWNRGAYLVEGPGHCAECHSPRDAFGGILAGARFAGGTTPDGKHKVPNITQDKDGIGDWSVADIAGALTDGSTPDGDFLGGEMADVVKSIGQLPVADRHAIAVYIKSLPPHPTTH